MRTAGAALVSMLGLLLVHCAPPEQMVVDTLTAMAPISVRTEDEKDTAGNLVSTMSVTLHSDEPDPLKRLRKIHETTRSSKATAEAVGARTMTDVTQFMPGVLAGLGARAYTRLGLANRVRPFLNTVITNVPGPQIPLYFTGAQIVATVDGSLVVDGDLASKLLVHNQAALEGVGHRRIPREK